MPFGVAFDSMAHYAVPAGAMAREAEGQAKIPAEVLEASKVSKEVRSLLGDNPTFQLLGSTGTRSSSGRKRSRPDYYQGQALCPQSCP